MGDISIKGKSPILRQSFAVGGAVRKLGKGIGRALKGRKGRGKDFKTHGKDVPTMAAEGGRIGLQSGGPHPGKVKKWISPPGKKRKGGKLPKAGGPTHINPKWVETRAEGGRIGFKKGTDKNWMQKVSASIKKRGTKGKCTPITKPGCTGRAKALAKTFKKIAAKRKA